MSDTSNKDFKDIEEILEGTEKKLYILRDHLNGLTKIGTSKNLDKRLKQLKYDNNGSLEVVSTYETPHALLIEGVVKAFFKSTVQPAGNCKNEYFNVESAIIEGFVEAAIKFIEDEPNHGYRWAEQYIKSKRPNEASRPDEYYMKPYQKHLAGPLGKIHPKKPDLSVSVSTRNDTK